MQQCYDALVIVGFGGPEQPDDVIPFLENVLRGRSVPRSRLLEVAEHYHHFGGVSPLNEQVRALIAALSRELVEQQIDLPIYWGNRNWHPLLEETMQQVARNGHSRVLALVLSAYSSYSSCRQYREDIQRAQQAVGGQAPQVDKIRAFFNHPGFIEANVARLAEALERATSDQDSEVAVVFTAHSIPVSMAANCRYESQLVEASRLVAEACGVSEAQWDLVYQSRSGRPEDPWLEPDICDHLAALHARGQRGVVVLPIGFLSDHMEVLYDLDEEAQQVCQSLGLRLFRARTVGTHPRFVAGLRELIQERLYGGCDRHAVGRLDAVADVCPEDCCPAPARRPTTLSADRGSRPE
ncbi:MAG: ferrochelatase [Planctomycetaceae bacterium]